MPWSFMRIADDAYAPCRLRLLYTILIDIIRNQYGTGSTAEHPLHPLARHRPLRAAVRPPGADAEHPAARRSGRALPEGLLRGPHVLRQQGVAPHGPVLPQQRDAGAGAPRL